MLDTDITNPKRKALRINLDTTIFGSFAEIGAGQDVARRFFEAGAASGTIAKTISAYDMSVSDSIYGKTASKRYVSEERLKKMLTTEFDSVVSLLKKQKSPDTRFFAFANTVEAINFKKTNNPNGWIGVRFQQKPDSEPSEVILHVRMLENDIFLQQRTLGILGVNLIYACYNFFDEPVKFILSLLDYLSNDQIEVDMMQFCNDKVCIDNRLLSLLLVKYGLTKATVFDRYNTVHQPADLLYKKDILLLRGSFHPVTYVEMNMLKTGSENFKKDISFNKEKYLVLCELTLDNILDEGEFDANDYLDRVDLLTGMGVNVMISNYKENYRLAKYFARFKINRIGFVIGILTLLDIFDEKYYKNLKGGLLEAIGHLFTSNTKVYVYPALDRNGSKIITSEELAKNKKTIHLYNYLKSMSQIEDIKDFPLEKLHIFSRNVLKMISEKKGGWETMVPKFVVKMIKSRWMFGYQENVKSPDIGL